MDGDLPPRVLLRTLARASPEASPRRVPGAERVRAVALAHPSFGYRRVWTVLRHGQGFFINPKRVRRILKEEGLQKEMHFPRPRLPETGNLTAARPNQRWYADLTYVDTTDLGPVPLMVVLDACSRKVVGYELLRPCGAADALWVVNQAVLARFPKTGLAPGLVLKTDGGPQFVAHQFQDGLRILGITLQNSRKRRPEDNGMIESFNGHFKQDYLWVLEPMSFIQTRVHVNESMADYNTKRPHSSLGYLAPVEYEAKVSEEGRE